MKIETDQYVSKGQSLLEGDAVDRVEVLARFPMSTLRRLFIGRGDIPADSALLDGGLAEFVDLKPSVRLDLGTTRAEWSAEFVRFSDNVDPETRTMGVVVAVDKPFEKIEPGVRPPLSKGMFVQVLLRGRSQPDRVVVPRSALRDSMLYLVDAEDRLQRRPVKPLFNQGSISVIGEGLSGGERIVVSDLVPAVNGMALNATTDETLTHAVLSAARGEL